jgi:hypothetical protein
LTNEEISFHDVFQNIVTWICVILKSNMSHPNFGTYGGLKKKDIYIYNLNHQIHMPRDENILG